MPTSIAAPDVSIALPKIPYGEFSPIRLQGRYVRRGLPNRHAHSRVARFASVLRALRFHRRNPRTEPRDVARLSTSVRAAFTALPQGSSLRPGFCSPSHHRLIDPIRPTRHLAALSLYSRLYATSLLCRFNPA